MNIKCRVIRMSFLIYRDAYNAVARLSGRRIKLPWIDLKVWRQVPEHPSHRARQYVREILLATGLRPSPEHEYLLDEQ